MILTPSRTETPILGKLNHISHAFYFHCFNQPASIALTIYPTLEIPQTQAIARSGTSILPPKKRNQPEPPKGQRPITAFFSPPTATPLAPPPATDLPPASQSKRARSASSEHGTPTPIGPGFTALGPPDSSSPSHPSPASLRQPSPSLEPLAPPPLSAARPASEGLLPAPESPKKPALQSSVPADLPTRESPKALTEKPPAPTGALAALMAPTPGGKSQSPLAQLSYKERLAQARTAFESNPDQHGPLYREAIEKSLRQHDEHLANKDYENASGYGHEAIESLRLAQAGVAITAAQQETRIPSGIKASRIPDFHTPSGFIDVKTGKDLSSSEDQMKDLLTQGPLSIAAGASSKDLDIATLQRVEKSTTSGHPLRVRSNSMREGQFISVEDMALRQARHAKKP